jgi:hypothetical protein
VRRRIGCERKRFGLRVDRRLEPVEGLAMLFVAQCLQAQKGQPKPHGSETVLHLVNELSLGS